MANVVNTWTFIANTNFEHKESEVDAPKFAPGCDAAIGFFRVNMVVYPQPFELLVVGSVQRIHFRKTTE